MDLERLASTLAERGEPGYRAKQIWEWAANGVASWEGMTNLPQGLREDLARELPLSSLEIEGTAHSDDGTEKTLFQTHDRRPVETVLMRYRDGRRSVCLSSQSGCPLECSFCATGQMAFGRNLTASEILDQALHFRRSEPVTNAVFMGMGEPMLNLDSVIAACEKLPDVGIATSHTTVSTVGWAPGIERLATEGPRVRLALSMHAAEQDLRQELMPTNERYPLTEVIDACLHWHRERKRKVYIEYLMLGGLNDDPAQAVALAETLKPREVFKVNLIPYNPTSDGRYRGSTPEAIDAFAEVLRARKLPTTVRLTRGRDIAAACGQLAADLSPA